MKKILWISPRWPEPANDGAKIATLELMKHIQFEEKFEVTLLALLPEEETAPPITDVRLSEVRVLRRRVATGSYLSRFLQNPFLPITFGSFVEEKLEREVQKVVRDEHWDGIVFDGVHAAIPFLKRGFPAKSQLFYRAHNVEFMLWERAAIVHGYMRRRALKLQAMLVKRFEKKLVDRCEMTFPVSDEDAEVFSRICPDAELKVIRIGQNFSKEPPKRPENSEKPIVFGFIGRIDWMPNQQGLEWFLREVWPEVVKRDLPIELHIAGSGDSRWLDGYRSLPKITFLGKVKSVEAFYQMIDASIVPLFVGSGTRVKVIESSRFAIPCISTTLGVEGCSLTPEKSYVRAKNREEWLTALSSLSRTALKEVGLNAFLEMKKHYDSDEISRQFIRCLAQSLTHQNQ
jgi:glycosyltransferase involved in cell wall biosynthesis